jgi:hypothetical protein
MPLLHVAIIGAGPVGLEAAVLLRTHGFPVRIYEQGRVGEHLRRWGHVRMFSPWGLNVSPWGREQFASTAVPEDDALLTGDEFRQCYLEPLARCPLLADAICEDAAVLSIGRHSVCKQDEIGQANRRSGGFRLLIRNATGESIESADVVLDCSGTYGQHRWLGAGGIPCPGEMSVLSREHYTLPDIVGRDRDRFVRRTTLIAGAGYSAATAVAALAELAHDEPRTRGIWITRHGQSQPLPAITNDPLVERAALTATVNRLATIDQSCITWRPGFAVQGISRHLNTRSFLVAISPVHDPSAVTVCEGVDEILSLVGYRPDHSLYEELQVHQCYATQGPIKLAASLLGETSKDCLAQQGQGIDTLRNPELGFYILGAKSYGRDPRFLLKVGIEQVATIVAELCREAQG